MKRPSQKNLMLYPTTTCGLRRCFPIAKKITDHFPCLPNLLLLNAKSKSWSRTDEICPRDCHVKFKNNTSGRERLWDTALKFLCPGLFITSPDHLDNMISRQAQHLSKIILHLVHQWVINFLTSYVIIWLHWKNTLKDIFLHISKWKFHWVKRTFWVRFWQIFNVFHWNVERTVSGNFYFLLLSKVMNILVKRMHVFSTLKVKLCVRSKTD